MCYDKSNYMIFCIEVGCMLMKKNSLWLNYTYILQHFYNATLMKNAITDHNTIKEYKTLLNIESKFWEKVQS